METTRCSLEQIRYRILFGFFFLFILGELVGGTDDTILSSKSPAKISSVEKTTIPPLSKNPDLKNETLSPSISAVATSVATPAYVPASAALTKTVAPKLHNASSTEKPTSSSSQPPTIKSVVTEIGESTPLLLPVTKEKDAANLTEYISTPSISSTTTSAAQNISKVREIGTAPTNGSIFKNTSVPPHTTTHTPTTGPLAPSSEETSTSRPSFPTGPKPTPKQTPRDRKTKGQNDTIGREPSHTVSPTSTTRMNTTPVSASIPENSGKPLSTIAIILIILSVLIVVAVLIICLVFRHRSHSGSTNFHTGGWAGQAALPDDSGLEKEAEKGAVTAGERETRPTTLSTFSGKPQSEVTSLHMEEIGEKKAAESGETQQLLGSSPGGPGEVNGRVTE